MQAFENPPDRDIPNEEEGLDALCLNEDLRLRFQSLSFVAFEAGVVVNELREILKRGYPSSGEGSPVVVLSGYILMLEAHIKAFTLPDDIKNELPQKIEVDGITKKYLSQAQTDIHKERLRTLQYITPPLLYEFVRALLVETMVRTDAIQLYLSGETNRSGYAQRIENLNNSANLTVESRDILDGNLKYLENNKDNTEYLRGIGSVISLVDCKNMHYQEMISSGKI